MKKELYLPALRGHIGDWVYYLTLMKFSDIAERVKYAEEIYQSEKLKELLQRDVLPTRAKDIANYLKEQNQRFFNSITVGVYGGEPQWLEFKLENLKAQNIDIPVKEEGKIGLLLLTGEELLFAIDGQHRVAGIRKYEEQYSNDLLNEEVSVLFVGHQRTKEGLERTRRLFTTLNRYAKPVSPKHIIALDEDDIVAISTRYLLEEHELFNKNQISLSSGYSISSSDLISFTNIITLNRCNNYLLKAFFNYNTRRWNTFRKIRPNDDLLKKGIDFVTIIWDMFLETFEELSDYNKGIINNLNDAAIKYRNQNGGSILFRPIGLLIYSKVVATLIIDGLEINKIFNIIKEVKRELSDIPWNGVIWENHQKRMIVRDINQKTAYRLFLYMINYDLSKLKIDDNKLLSDYASLLNKDTNDVNLPNKIV